MRSALCRTGGGAPLPLKPPGYSRQPASSKTAQPQGTCWQAKPGLTAMCPHPALRQDQSLLRRARGVTRAAVGRFGSPFAGPFVYAWSLGDARKAMASRIASASKAVIGFAFAVAEKLLSPFSTWYFRAMGMLSLAIVATTAALNASLPVVNAYGLPHVEAAVTRILDREVCIGSVRWVMPTGLVGVTPLLSVGPISVGPSSVEGSSVQVPEAVIKLAPLSCLLQRAVVLRCVLETPVGELVQCKNFSWFGYPDDTDPSCRDFVPGLNSPPPSHRTASPPVGRQGAAPTRFASATSSALSGAAAAAADPRSGRSGAGSAAKVQKAAEAQGISEPYEAEAQGLKSAQRPMVGGGQGGEGDAAVGGLEARSEEVSRLIQAQFDVHKEMMSRQEMEAEKFGDSQRAGAAGPSKLRPMDAEAAPSHHKIEQESPPPGSLKQRAQGVLSALIPQVAVDRVTLRKAFVKVFVVGEKIPRIIKDADAYVSLGKGYRTLELDVKGWLEERDPGNKKFTMDNPFASINLRPVTPGAELPAAGEGMEMWYSMTGAREPQHPQQVQLKALVARLHSGAGDGSSQEVNPAIGSASSKCNGSGRVNSSPQGGAAPLEGENGARASLAAASSGLSAKEVEGGSQGEVMIGSPDRPLSKVRVRLVARHIGVADRWPDMAVSIQADDLHAPLVERLLPVPMDINEGYVSGELRLRAHNKDTWRFPSLRGRIHCRDLEIHFWDSPDSLSGTAMDLLFEGDRMYLHNASGHFGGVPLTITGDMDINPEGGHYRLSASIPSVDMNTLRATLGARPLPLSVAGAVRGVLHCTGPLEFPVFSGTAIAVPPSQSQIAASEDTDAKAALLSAPGSVGAYDKVPFQSASAVFTFDTSSSAITIHSFRAEPAGGGVLVGSGRMWVAPEAEMDPRAISFRMEGRSLPTTRLIKSYMPPGLDPPLGDAVGGLFVKGTMEGSHMDSTILSRWEVPSLGARGTANLSPAAIAVTGSAPTFDLKGTAHLAAPDHQKIRMAVTQKEAKEAGEPIYTGADFDLTLKELDAMPLLTNTPGNGSGTQPVRLKLSGTTKFSGRLVDEQQGVGGGALFLGDLSLQDLKINQLRLTRHLSGQLRVDSGGAELRAMGRRPDEALHAAVSMPINLGALVRGEASPAPPPRGISGRVSLRRGQLYLGTHLSEETGAVFLAAKELTLDELELGSLRGIIKEATVDCNLSAREGLGTIHVSGPRCNGLQGEELSGAVQWSGDSVRLKGATLQQANSRYELEGDYLIPETSAIPSSPMDVASTLSHNPEDAEDPLRQTLWTEPGRWRLKLSVPGAELEEILPAARLLSAATGEQHIDYDKAKEGFLKGVPALRQHAQQLCNILDSKARRTMLELGEDARGTAYSGGQNSGETKPLAKGLPGLQDLRGHWSGSMEAFGGGGRRRTVHFDLHGNNWAGGPYSLDDVTARGSYHEAEGLNLQQFSIQADDAVLLVKGALLGPNQNAVLVLNDFPAVLLSPVLRSIPAFQNAVPAASAPQASGEGGGRAGDGGGGKRPTRLTEHLRNLTGSNQLLQVQDKYSAFAGSPINGRMFVHGSIRGSAEEPQGDIAVRLFNGAIGPTRLAEAAVHIQVDAEQFVCFNLNMQPEDAPGYVKVAGKVPIKSLGGRGSAVEGEDGGGAPDALEVEALLKDSGMMLMSAASPDFRWLGGSADIAVQMSGTATEPRVEGTAHLTRASVYCRNLKYPITNMNATINVDSNLISIEELDADVGKKGMIKVDGRLPLQQDQDRQPLPEEDLISVDVSDLELKIRNTYTGLFDGQLKLRGSASKPRVGGTLRFSRGTAYLLDASGQPGGASITAEAAEAEESPIAKALAALTATNHRPSPSSSSPSQPSSPAVPASHDNLVDSADVSLEGLSIELGPDLRAIYPVVLNFGLSGKVELNGPASDAIKPAGAIHFEGGDINLVATKLSLSREHPNSISFTPEAGLNPNIDILLQGEDLTVLIQGPASDWTNCILLTYTGKGGDALEGQDPAKLAQIFEDQLKEAILEEDGQIAFSNLAASAVSSVLPKMETHGQLGKARWRLVSAPSLPGLLSLDPNLDISNLLSGLTAGTEVEFQFGKSIQAAMARKIKGNETGTELTLLYNINSNLRIRLNLLGPSPSLVIGYSSEGVPK